MDELETSRCKISWEKCTLKNVFVSLHCGWCCVHKVGSQASFSQDVIAPCDLFLHFYIYKASHKKEPRSSSNNNRQTKNPPQRNRNQQATPPRFMIGRGNVIGSMIGEEDRVRKTAGTEGVSLLLALFVRAGANLPTCWNKTVAIVSSAELRSLCTLGREEAKEKSE